VQTGARLSGFLLRQRWQHLLQGGLLQVTLLYTTYIMYT
jgi:hypothetical protein